MLLTLNVSSLRPMLKGSRPELTLLDVPAFARQTLELHGLNLTTDLLKGSSRDQLVALRERSDRAGCACLLLIEPDVLSMKTDARAEKSVARALRVVEAAHLLGCNAASIAIDGQDGEDELDHLVEHLRLIVKRAEAMELNLLLAPAKGLTEDPDRMIDLVKKVGGFRIGTLPDFETAAASEDPAQYLRRLTPYASIVSASTRGFTVDGKEAPHVMGVDEIPDHEGYDLQPLIETVAAVGYDGTLAIDYRGEGDPTVGLLRSKAALENAMERAAEAG